MKHLIILVGESGSGKNYLAEKSNIYRIITHTTRSPRPNEANGIDYFFENTVPDKNDNNIMTLDNFQGNFYWTTCKDIEDALEKYNNCIMIATFKGFQELISNTEFKNNIFGIYLHTSKEQLKEHILKRDASKDEKSKRIETLPSDTVAMKKEINFLNYQRTIILNSSNLDENIKILKSITK